MPRSGDDRPRRPSDEDLEKLCYGRVIYGRLRNKKGDPVKEPHYGIILNADTQIERIKLSTRPIYTVICISNSEQGDEKFRLPAPARLGLCGHVQGEWQTEVEEAEIIRIEGKLSAPEMIKVQELIRLVKQTKQADKETQS